jgi:hypothetical protein
MWKLQQELEADFVLKGKQYFSGSIPVEQVCMGRCTEAFHPAFHFAAPRQIRWCCQNAMGRSPFSGGSTCCTGHGSTERCQGESLARSHSINGGSAQLLLTLPKHKWYCTPPSKFSGGCSCRVDIAADDGIWKTNQDRSLELTILPEIASCFLLGRRSKPRVDATPDPLAPCDWGPLVLKTNPNHPDQPLG